VALSYDEALTQPGPLLAAWSLPDDDFVTLSIYSLAGGGAAQLAVKRLPLAQKRDVTQKLEASGLRIGDYDLGNEHVWSRSGDRFTAWSATQRLIDVHDGVIDLGGRTLAAGEVAAVVSYADPSMVERGVRLVLSSSKVEPVAVEQSAVAAADSTYGRNELLFESTWASLLARSLAQAVGASFRDEI
jgi:hypothetical protein